MSKFRVLCLDGGGIKGAFTAAVLADLERMLESPIVSYFDLVVGTSTGGIIALALGLGVRSEDIRKFYEEHGPTIFPSTGVHRRLGRILKHIFRPKHSSEVLRQTLTTVLGARKLGESVTRLAIPCFDCNAGRIQMFKTAHHDRFVHDFRVAAVDVALATSAAPTYFSAFNTAEGQSFLDGGVWANCPVMVGLLEAMYVLNIPPEDVHILSLGTTDDPFDVSRVKRIGGLLSWGTTAVTLIMRAQADAAISQARLVIGERLLRLDAIVRPGRFTLDDSSRISELVGLGKFTAKDRFEVVAERFFGNVAAPFIPCHTLSAAVQVPEVLKNYKFMGH
ncbi:CBASS cGAMP-activated phospholipase [Paludibaculum fermentans]|uniref:Patatin-like phospholipase family protein n=1 Tax=Paludibaculum fermentans TaxID=1473598 RepID=A0A7S7NRX8_PALFE|nr:CBASS cGAMP-activated phospholipase [Paludibaculum fermentans]QOY88677.1 patatin-like phospholipase family protein [Paludibaculum fermentans]